MLHISVQFCIQYITYYSYTIKHPPPPNNKKHIQQNNNNRTNNKKKKNKNQQGCNNSKETKTKTNYMTLLISQNLFWILNRENKCITNTISQFS